MKQKLKVIPLAMSALISSLTVFSGQSCEVSNSSTAVNTDNEIAITNVMLMAREERHVPPGQPPIPNRDIGFADVVMQIQNTTEENATLIVQSIKICTVVGGRVQLSSQHPQAIHLHPLENSTLDVHLTNQTGYSWGDRVKVIIRYQIREQIHTIESAPVTVERL